jgi:uncharacterized protein with ParB-like and HNH nuclease domain
MNNLNNTSITFSNLLELKNFKIPDYQRAFAWEEKQLNLFVSDLVEYEKNIGDTNKKYYLGHFIFEKNDSCDEFEVVDGQQRLTTIFLFMLVCKSISKQNTIFDNLKFIPVSYDKNGFNKILSELNSENKTNEHQFEINETASLERMEKAVEFFKTQFSQVEKNKKILEINKIDMYLKILMDAYCSFVVFNDKSVSSQVFELHNTRGLPLTETEKVKSTLMKMVYMHSDSNDVNENIKTIEIAFAEIFKYEEHAKDVWFRGELPLDNILMYHLRAVEDNKKAKDFSKPYSVSGENGCYEYIKNILANKKNKEDIVTYCLDVSNHFANSMKIISEVIPRLDLDHPAIGDSILLNKNRSLIFYLRLFRGKCLNFENQKYLFIRWEHFLFYNDLMEWSGYFYKKNNRGEFDSIYKVLDDMNNTNDLLIDYYKYISGKSFASNWKPVQEILKECFVDKSNVQDNLLKRIYGNFKINIAYLLYKFEISKSGIDYKNVRSQIFKKNQVSIDHIVAQNLSWENFGYANFDTLEQKEREIAENEWKKVEEYIHGIGNLSLSIASSNSSDSNNLPQAHSETFRNLGLNYTSKTVENWSEPLKFAENIKERGFEILHFINEEFITNKYWESN